MDGQSAVAGAVAAVVVGGFWGLEWVSGARVLRFSKSNYATRLGGTLRVGMHVGEVRCEKGYGMKMTVSVERNWWG